MTDRLQRLAGGIARELQEQRRQVVKSLRVVHLPDPGPWKRVGVSHRVVLRVHVQPQPKEGSCLGPYARPTDLTGFPRQHLQL